MSRLEKVLGLISTLVALTGVIFALAGQYTFALTGALVLGIYAVYLVAQVLREARYQKRKTELLREYAQASRQDLVARSQTHDEIVSQVLSEIQNRLVAGQVGLQDSLDTLRSTTTETRGLVHESQDAILAGVNETASHLAETVKASSSDVRRAQQVISQRVLAHQDGSRQLLDEACTILASQDQKREVLQEGLGEIKRSLAARRESSILAEIDSSIVRLEGALSELQTQVGGTGARVTEGLKSVEDFGERLDRFVRESGVAAKRSMGAISDRMEELRSGLEGGAPFNGIDIDVAVEAHREGLDRTWRILRSIQMAPALADGQRNRLLGAMYSVIGMGEVRQEFVLDVTEFDIGVSFRAQMVRLLLLKERLRGYGYDLSPRLNDKLADSEFARRLGLPTPESIGENVSISNLAIIPGTIIKPTVGESSTGVFFVRPDGRLLSIKSRRTYSTLEEALPEYERLMDEEQALTWIVEEAILDSDDVPATDFKVFMFYGRVGMFVEILRGRGDSGEAVTCTYAPDGTPIKYRAGDNMIEGHGVPDGVVDMATRISQESPMPFLRVDFLLGSDGPVVGEITPHPGGIYAGDADDYMDRILGEMYLDADARLTIDFLNGKRFSQYFESYQAGKSVH